MYKNVSDNNTAHDVFFCASIMSNINHIYTLFVLLGISASFLCANGRPVLGSDPRQNPKHGVKQIIQMETLPGI